jgi:hypothetical protein
MKSVTVLAEKWPLKRFEMFRDGFLKLGYTVNHKSVMADMLVIWNRYREGGKLADEFEAEMNGVIVAENAYISPDSAGRKYTALSRTGHNGSGYTPYAGPERWARMEIDLHAWRKTGDWILLCGQRGLGAPGMAMPKSFMGEVREMLQTTTGRHIEMRDPPALHQNQRPLKELWPLLSAVVVWTSNMATVSLINGVPAYYMGPHHIMAGAATNGVDKILEPTYPDREAAFRRLAWAQWTREEIESGEALKWLGC